jgi:hypothetical protein
MTAVVKGINVLEPPLDVNSHALSETGVKIQVAKVGCAAEAALQVAVVGTGTFAGSGTFAQSGFVALNSQSLAGIPAPLSENTQSPPLVEAATHSA